MTAIKVSHSSECSSLPYSSSSSSYYSSSSDDTIVQMHTKLRGVIDLLSYMYTHDNLDLHAAWPVAGCPSSSRLLGVCLSSSSSNVMSGSWQLRGTLFLLVTSRRLSGCAAVPSFITRPRRGDYFRQVGGLGSIQHVSPRVCGPLLARGPRASARGGECSPCYRGNGGGRAVLSGGLPPQVPAARRPDVQGQRSRSPLLGQGGLPPEAHDVEGPHKTGSPVSIEGKTFGHPTTNHQWFDEFRLKRGTNTVARFYMENGKMVAKSSGAPVSQNGDVAITLARWPQNAHLPRRRGQVRRPSRAL